MSAPEPFAVPEAADLDEDHPDRTLRLLAFAVDTLLPPAAGLAATMGMLGAVVVLHLVSRDAGWLDLSLGLVVAPGVMAFLGVSVAQWSGLARQGQSFGKRWTGLRVVRMDGTNAGFVRAVVVRSWLGTALGRALCFWSSLDPLTVFLPARRCLHDYMAGTRVVTAARVADTLQP